jgi:hypothetical protein
MALEMKIEANWIRSFVYEVCSLMRLCIMERYHIKVTTHLANRTCAAMHMYIPFLGKAYKMYSVQSPTWITLLNRVFLRLPSNNHCALTHLQLVHVAANVCPCYTN